MPSRVSPRLAASGNIFIDNAAGHDDDDDSEDDDFVDDDDEEEEAASDGAAEEVMPPLAKKKRGRPPKTKELETPIYYPDMDEAEQPEFSLTYGKTGGHMPAIWHTSMSEYMEEHSPKFLNSRERGLKNEHLHGQCIAKLPIATDKASIEKVKKEMKRAMGCSERDGSGCRIELKELVTGQTFVRMVGYCLKDQGQPHFVMTKKNVSDEE
jgi:hypothetical protein